MATVTRVLGSVFGVFFLIISVPMMLGGVVVLALPAVMADDQGYINTPTIHLKSTESYAFVSESFKLDNNNNHQSNSDVKYEFDNYGKIINVRVTANSYFLGLARTSDVQQYLGNVQYEVVNDMHDQSVSTYSVNSGKNGSLTTSPSEQSFWLVSGNDALYYTPSKSDFNQDLSLVVMNTDGSQGVDTNLQIGVNIPILVPIGVILLVVGSLFFILTITLFVVAYKSKDTGRVVKYYTVYSQVPVENSQSDKHYMVENSTHSNDVQLPASKTCTNCGNQSDLDANFCETCGYGYKN